MNGNQGKKRTCDPTARQFELDRNQVAPAQCAFAKVVGELLAERWAKLHEPQVFDRSTEQLPSGAATELSEHSAETATPVRPARSR